MSELVLFQFGIIIFIAENNINYFISLLNYHLFITYFITYLNLYSNISELKKLI